MKSVTKNLFSRKGLSWIHLAVTTVKKLKNKWSKLIKTQRDVCHCLFPTRVNIWIKTKWI